MKVLVMTYLGAPETLPLCLAHLQNQTTALDSVIQIRGDGKTTESEDIARGFGETDAEYIFTTNADCYVSRNFVAALSTWLDKGYGIASGVRWQIDPIGAAFNARLPSRPRYKMQTGLGISGGCLAFRREVLDGLLPFKFSTGWDLEMGLRATTKIVIDPSVIAIHDHPFRSKKELLLRSRDYAKRAVVMTREFGDHKIEKRIPAMQGSPIDNLVFLLGQIGGLLP